MNLAFHLFLESYNLFHQPTQILEGDYRLRIVYGADQQRNMGTLIIGRRNRGHFYYINKHFEIAVTDSARYLHYIYGDHGVVALHIITEPVNDVIDPEKPPYGEEPDAIVLGKGSAKDTGNIYYIHTDHLGSYCALTDAGRKVVQRNIFDVWGNPYSSVASMDTNPNGPMPRAVIFTGFNITNRGFTGHEHYDEVKIINMNGRLYDPIIGRFFSSDNFVQAPEFSQGFNRYSYCLNNPLKYTDPTGEKFIYTKYVNEQGELLYETNDGLTDIIIVPEKNISQLENVLNEANVHGTINDPEFNKDVLHKLGTEILKYRSIYDTKNENQDAGFVVGYERRYNDMSTKWTNVLYFGLAFGKDGAEMRVGYNRGKEQGTIDRIQGKINVLNPWESLKNNPPLLKLYQ